MGQLKDQIAVVTGAGRGIGLMFVIAGLLAVVVSGLTYLNPHIRELEQELPDAIAG